MSIVISWIISMVSKPGNPQRASCLVMYVNFILRKQYQLTLDKSVVRL